VSRAETQESIQRQIRAEKAGALRHAFERLEGALAALAAHDARHGAAAGEARRLLLEEAGERLWFIVIQREAMGLRRHDVLYDVLKIPGEVRLAMGPRARR
jgi:uncharacterized protein DUF6665